MTAKTCSLFLMAAISLAAWPSAADNSNDWPKCNTAQGDDAISACSNLIALGKLNPHDLARAYFNLGLAEKSRGKLGEAIVDFNRTIRLDPKDETAYFNRGVARQIDGDLIGASADFNRAIKLKPDYAEAYSKRADITTDLNAKITDFTRVMQLDPNFEVYRLAFAYVLRGNARMGLQDPDGAIADYNKALQLEPGEEIYRERAEARKAKGDIAGALADYNEAVGRYYDDPSVYVGRAGARQLNSDLDGAIADLTKAIEINPNYASAYTQRGGLWEVKGDYDRARADYSAALATNSFTGFPSEAQKQAKARLAALNPSQLLEIPLIAAGGTFEVPVEINGTITLNFIVDSGAADVTIPADVFSTLIRTGKITPTDFTGTQTYVLADGYQSPSNTFMIRSLKIGDKVVENVRASIVPAAGTPLLGQSFLQHFKSWSIDNLKHNLLLEPAR